MKTQYLILFTILIYLFSDVTQSSQISKKSDLIRLKTALQNSDISETKFIISDFFKKDSANFTEKINFFYANMLICLSKNHRHSSCFEDLKININKVFTNKGPLKLTLANQSVLKNIYIELSKNGNYDLLHLISQNLKKTEDIICKSSEDCLYGANLVAAIASYDDDSFIFFANKLSYAQMDKAKIIYYYFNFLKNTKDKRCADLEHYLKKTDPLRYKIISCDNSVDLSIVLNSENRSIAFSIKASYLLKKSQFEDYKKLVDSEKNFFFSHRNKYLYLRHLQNVYWIDKDKNGLSTIFSEINKNRDLRFLGSDNNRLRLVDLYNELKIKRFLTEKNIDQKIDSFNVELNELKKINSFKEKFLSMSDLNSQSLNHTVTVIPDMIDAMYLLK